MLAVADFPNLINNPTSDIVLGKFRFHIYISSTYRRGKDVYQFCHSFCNTQKNESAHPRKRQFLINLKSSPLLKIRWTISTSLLMYFIKRFLILFNLFEMGGCTGFVVYDEYNYLIYLPLPNKCNQSLVV